MKKYLIGKEARQALLAGAQKLATVVGSSMGPMGRNTVLDKAPRTPYFPTSTRDGVTIARDLYLEGFEDTGSRLVREAADKTVKEAGDGTTAAVVLAHAIFELGIAALDRGVSVVDVKNEIERDVTTLCGLIDKHKIRISGPMLDQVATIATNNDPVLGKLIADSVRASGVNGVVAVEDSPSCETTIERQEGMQFNQGYVSQAFVNKESNMSVEFFEPLILLLDRPLSSMQGLLPLMNAIANGGRPLLVLAEDVTGEALATLVMNKLKGGMACCAVKLPSNLGHRKDLLLDIAALTNGVAVLQELGMDISSLKPTHLGRARKVVVTNSVCRIIDGYGQKDAIKKRVDEIQGLMAQGATSLERERLTERLAKLTGGVTILKLGATTGLELGDKKDRCDDACNATRCALADGIVPGGGFTLARLAIHLPSGIVKEACYAPAMQILKNAGESDDTLIRALDLKEYDEAGNMKENIAFGYNSLTCEFGNLVDMGVIDPAKVVKASLRNAASVATTMLLTECLIQEVK